MKCGQCLVNLKVSIAGELWEIPKQALLNQLARKLFDLPDAQFVLFGQSLCLDHALDMLYQKKV